jgi:23S rRNA (pseudouridine1915-N3)-methyltransferase
LPSVERRRVTARGPVSLTIACVGKARAHLAQSLAMDYLGRLCWPARIVEVETKRPLGAVARIARESELLRAALSERALIVALDAQGQALDSAAFAQRLTGWIGAGRGEIGFIVGGADGLDQGLKRDADFILSLGPMTWPHLMVRAMLAEQLYRAQTILTGHPYHRA